MYRRVIPIIDERHELHVSPLSDPPDQLRDSLDRPLRDLRISVTDRCNFRCTYCMPKEVFGSDHAFVPRSELLSFEEITRLTRQFVHLGVRKIRLTGGEPLLRRGLEDLVGMLAAIRSPEGDPLDLSLTTNGSLLARKARALKDAGLQRITVSLDAVDDVIFRRMNDVDFHVGDVLTGIDAALRADLAPLKVNMVVQRGVNDGQIIPVLERFRGSGVIVRFIEYMDVGNTNGWRMERVLPSALVIERIAERYPLVPKGREVVGETAQRWSLSDGSAEFGVISSISQPFCGSCNRARLSMDGKLFLCLFASAGYDLRRLLRGNKADDAQLRAAIGGIWHARGDRYSQLRSQASAPRDGQRKKIEMSYIGG